MVVEKIKHKWLRPYLIGLSNLFDRRWDYWLRTIEEGRVLDEPIPQINFTSTPSEDTIKNLDQCINYMASRGYSNSFDHFVDWLLFGFGDSEVQELAPQISDEINEYWYRNFDLSLFYLDRKEQKQFIETGVKPEVHGFDYMGYYASTNTGKGKWWNPNSFYATPPNVVKMMVEMMVGDREGMKTQIFNEPCCGSGIFFLYMSNYCLRMYGQDISHNMVKLARVNAWTYIPWMAWIPDVEIGGLGDSIDEVKSMEEIIPVQKQATLEEFFVSNIKKGGEKNGRCGI